MSDTSQGPGWWKASDGKWYAPELYPSDWPAPDPVVEVPASRDEVFDAGASVASAAEVAEAPAAVEWPEIKTFGVDEVTEPASPGQSIEAELPTEPVDQIDSAVDRGAHARPDETAQVPIATEPGDTGRPSWEPSQAGPEVGESTLSAPPVIAPPVEPPAIDPSDAPTVVQKVVTPASIAPEAEAPSRDSWRTWGADETPTRPPSEWDVAGEPATSAAPSLVEDEIGDVPSGSAGLLGAALLIIGSFLTWAKAGGTLTGGSVNGLSGSNGWGTLIAGLVVGSAAGMLFAGLRKSWVALALGVAALTGLVLAIFSYVDIGSTSDDLPGLLAGRGVPSEIANGAVLDIDTGLWIAIAGAVVGLIAAVMAFARRPRPV